MAVVIEGPGGGGSTGTLDEDYNVWTYNLDNLLASTDTDSVGVSVQKSGSFELNTSMHDEVANKVGPMIGRWDPEKGSRMVQEF